MALEDPRAALLVEAVGIPLNCVVPRVIEVHWHCIVVVVKHAVAHQDAEVHLCLGNLENAVVIVEFELTSSLRVRDEKRVDEESASERVLEGGILEVSMRQEMAWVGTVLCVCFLAVFAFIFLDYGVLCRG